MSRGNLVVNNAESFPGQDLLFGKPLDIPSKIAVGNKDYLVQQISLSAFTSAVVFT
jgi:hypothetical protein